MKVWISVISQRIIESSLNHTDIVKLLNESHYKDIFTDLSLIATYLILLILLIAIPATVIPATVIIQKIRKTEELHSHYCLLLVNMLIVDISNAIRYCFGFIIIVLYLLDIRVYISDIAYIIITLPWIATQYSFVLLAIDRVMGVAFPYHYRNIMKSRVGYALIAFVWIIAAVRLLLLCRIIFGTSISSVAVWSIYPSTWHSWSICSTRVTSGCISNHDYWHQYVLASCYYSIKEEVRK